MAQPTIKTSFASGEWAPKLRSRVDVQKYHAGAALLRNFYVDYSGGGASTRQGTRFINQCKALGSRLLPFQPSTTVSYVLEFGQNYVRFFSNGAAILESAMSGVTAATTGGLITIPNTFSNGDWVFATGFGGLTGINGNYFLISAAGAGNVTLQTLNGQAVAFGGAWTAGGSLAQVYTVTTPYNASDLFPNPATGNPGLKFVQNVTSLIITHPSYPAKILTIQSPNNWTFASIKFGPTIATTTVLGGTATLPAGSFTYGYLVTAVDINGQESAPSLPEITTALANFATTPGTITISWAGVTGAVSYNVYKTTPAIGAATIPAGAQYGFIGNVSGTSIIDSSPGLAPDFSLTPPIVQNPFLGASVTAVNVIVVGNYTVVPTVTIGPPAAGGVQATAYAQLSVVGDATNSGGFGYTVGDTITFAGGIVVKVASTAGNPGPVTSFVIQSFGSITSGNTPANPQFGGGGTGNSFSVNWTWGVGSIVLVNGGAGYTAQPAVAFNTGGAVATTTIGTASAGNPGVPGFLQERLMLAGQPGAIQGYNLSQPATFYNFNISNPSQDDDAISGNIISEELNDIRSLTPVPTGIVAFTGRGAWLINGGGGISTLNPITPSNQTATPQAYNGANDLRPLKINYDALYGTNKGNYIRDLTFNIYANIYTGSDISVLSNHLFFGYYLSDWCLAEEPFKTVWAVRNDGVLLSLGYVKEQELIGWAHHDTNGQFTSVCSVIETTNGNVVDAVYVIVQRLVNGFTVQYIERMADRFFPYGYEDAWSVDCGLQTQPQVSPNGTLSITGDASIVGNVVTLTDTADAPFTGGMVGWVVRAGGGIYTITAFTSSSVVTASVMQVPSLINVYTNVPFPVNGGWTIWQPVATVSGLTQLIGQTVTGVADGVVVPPTVVSGAGSINLANAATKVTLGLAFLPQLQTLPLDLGEPTIQGKRKKITGVTLRVADTLGLQIGTSFSNVVTMKDFVIGNVGTQSNQIVTGLVSGDGRTIIDQAWQEAGSYCIQQNLPYPATVLGAMPEIAVGDTK